MRKFIIEKLVKHTVANMLNYGKLGELLVPLSIDSIGVQYSMQDLHDFYKIFPAILLKRY